MSRRLKAIATKNQEKTLDRLLVELRSQNFLRSEDFIPKRWDPVISRNPDLTAPVTDIKSAAFYYLHIPGTPQVTMWGGAQVVAVSTTGQLYISYPEVLPSLRPEEAISGGAPLMLDPNTGFYNSCPSGSAFFSTGAVPAGWSQPTADGIRVDCNTSFLVGNVITFSFNITYLISGRKDYGN